VDQDLVRNAMAGDEEAFDALATAAFPRLFQVALGILREALSADDATQQAIITIWRTLPRLRDPARFDAWAYRILVRTCYAEAKRRRAWLPEAAISGDDIPVAVDDLLGVLTRDQLERGFRRLSAEHRAVIVLRYMLDLPLDRVADALDIPVGTVDSRLHRALKALRAALEADARPARTAGQPRFAE
jgi:RNA polymerase sigma-70 factor (ECF subfamily)